MNWPSIGALLMCLGVMLGAFGAHALRERFDAYATGIWEKAVLYHFIHGMALFVVSILPRSHVLGHEATGRVCWLFLLGVLFFSGSLYALAATGVRGLGAVTPIGGLAFIAAWLLLAWELYRIASL